MKKLVIEKEIPTFVPRECRIHKFYGAQKISDNSKGFVSRPYFKDGKFQIRTIDYITEGNHFNYNGQRDASSSEHLETFLNRIAKYNEFNIFEFETAKELFAWLSQD
jgi:hypothetical protein